MGKKRRIAETVTGESVVEEGLCVRIGNLANNLPVAPRRRRFVGRGRPFAVLPSLP